MTAIPKIAPGTMPLRGPTVAPTAPKGPGRLTRGLSPEEARTLARKIGWEIYESAPKPGLFSRLIPRALRFALHVADFLACIDCAGDSGPRRVPQPIDQPPVGTTISEWQTQMQKAVQIAIDIATLQQQIRLMEEYGLGDWTRDAKEQLDSLVAQTQAIAHGTGVPFTSGALKMVASTGGAEGAEATPEASSSVDKSGRKILAPLFPGVEVIYHRGKYQIQLEVFPDSTLSASDIERILTIASWEQHPQTLADGFEGGRSILIRREHPTLHPHLDFGAIQISGIGYRKITPTDQQGYVCIAEDTFLPPSSENFLQGIPPDVYGYSSASGDQLQHHTSTYLPLGAYLQREIVRKVEGTRIVSAQPFETFATPTVEAYGRFLDPEFAHEGLPFGFLVLSTPGIQFKRAYEDLAERMRNAPPEKAFNLFLEDATRSIQIVSTALRELHDFGFAHLQPHFSNYYIIDGTLVLVDWETITPLNGTLGENALNRSLDLYIPVRDRIDVMKRFFQNLLEAMPREWATRLLQFASACYLRNTHETMFEPDTTGHFEDLTAWMRQFVK